MSGGFHPRSASLLITSSFRGDHVLYALTTKECVAARFTRDRNGDYADGTIFAAKGAPRKTTCATFGVRPPNKYHALRFPRGVAHGVSPSPKSCMHLCAITSNPKKSWGRRST
jgi:hypothetical protein